MKFFQPVVFNPPVSVTTGARPRILCALLFALLAPLAVTNGASETVSALPRPASAASAISADGLTLTGGRLTLKFTSDGTLANLLDPRTGNDFAHTAKRPLIALVLDGKVLTPAGFKHTGGGVYLFTFADGGIADALTVRVKAVARAKYISFEAVAVTNTTGKDLKYLVWGPVPVALKDKMAETLGFAYNDDYGIGLMALNVKTIAGRPEDVGHIVPRANWAPMRVSENWAAAVAINDGVKLRAFCQDRSRTRVRRQHMQYGGVIEKLDVHSLPNDKFYGADREITGTKIALYGCAPNDIYDVIDEMAAAENLPRPTTGGVWNKAPRNRIHNNLRSMFLGHTFDERTLDARLYQTRRLGADMFFAYNCFRNYNGDYTLANFSSYEDFHNRYARFAEAMDISLGTKDRPPFIAEESPVVLGAENVDRNVLKANTATLAEAIPAGAAGDDAASGNTSQLYAFNGTLTAVKLGYFLLGGKEVVTGVIKDGKLQLTKRGLQGTTAQNHAAGSGVSSLVNFQNWGKNFVPSLAYYSGDMLALAEWCNKGGFRIADMDGQEKSLDNGYGIYLFNKIADLWYNAVKNKERLKWNGSGLTQWTWHIAYPMQWGERNGNIIGEYKYRIGTNYDYFYRNFFTPSLGMNGLGKNTTRLQANYVGSKAAAFNSQLGVSDGTKIDITSEFYTGGISSSPIANELFDILREWTVARDAGAFTIEQRSRMAPAGTQFNLTVVEPAIEWKLETIAGDGTDKITRAETARAPGIVNHATVPAARFTGSAKNGIKNAGELNNRRVATGSENLANAGDGAQFITVDLGEEKPVDQIRFWHDFEFGKRYNAVVVALSNDAAFRTKTIVFNNDAENVHGLGAGTDKVYSESFTGKTIELPQTLRARHVRFYSAGWKLIRKSGTTTGTGNDYAEIQILSGKRTIPESLRRDERAPK
ncbi:MAG: discoidin domain-containing protein [Puniceicoccales bacterium]|jgi:hypothetical protein|nr:discoidin domain-containing protein [Puniceicoccales bacterium]